MEFRDSVDVEVEDVEVERSVTNGVKSRVVYRSWEVDVDILRSQRSLTLSRVPVLRCLSGSTPCHFGPS